MPASRVRKTLHFQETNLIKAAGKDIDNMAIVCDPLCQVVIKLDIHQLKYITCDHYNAYLESFLVVFDVITVNVMVRSNRLPELWSDDHTRPFSRRPSAEQHNPATHVDELSFQ